ncbi:MAG: hypothetical protein LBK23_12430 [Oscillospiraceae bacterium]|jgi:hypothetical protein|nr:hypothetical protein [Oscillospiraceae bacterium]
MDYESLLKEYSERAQEVKNLLGGASKLYKRVSADMEQGELRGAAKDIAALEETAVALSDAVAGLRSTALSFDCKQYVASGDFMRQFIDCCEKEGLEYKEDGGALEIFPYRVRLDAEANDVYLDRKKLPGLRPRALVKIIVKSRAKFYSAAFNPTQFASELAFAYGVAVMNQNQGRRAPLRNPDVFLSEVYKYLAPMRRFRREYDKQAYAFDLARLYMAPDAETDDGRRFQFGAGRSIGKAIRITDPDGNEHFLTTICFFDKEI